MTLHFYREGIQQKLTLDFR